MMTFLLVLASAAQTPPERPRAHVPTLTATEIALDAALTESAWERAAVLNRFVSVEPLEGVAADPPWEVRIFRTETHLYLGLTMWEPEPERMVLQNIRRDAFLEEDDRVEFVLDTFCDGKTAYFFQVAAGGSRGDALIGDNGQRFNKPWNGFWEAEIAVLADRWVAEIRIPFATLGFGAGDVWRANFERGRGADRSTSRWAATQREFRVQNVREAGELSGFAGARQGMGLEFRPYATLHGRDGADPADGDGFDFDAGGEVSWRITSQLTASLTWNTDFAETEVDERQVNLSRFPLFFPEKRDFFLQDSTLFQFGEQGGRFGSGGGNLLPFFSRRIGLVDEVEVPIDVGARLAGRAGPWDLGFLGVHTGGVPEIGVPEADLFVLRPAYRINGDLAIGGLLTHGNPAAAAENTLAGADLRWSSTEFLPGNFTLNAFVVASDDDASATAGASFGMEASLRTSDWQFSLRSLGAHADFRPGLGFVRRPGEWLTSATIEWQPRPEDGPIRLYSFELQPVVWTDLHGDLISSDVQFRPFGVEFHDGDELGVELTVSSDRPAADFEIADGVVVAAGAYSWAEVAADYEWSQARPISGEIEASAGSFYDGSLVSFGGALNWRPGPRFRASLGYEENRGSLDGGDFVTRLERFALDVNFSPALAWQNLLQADNESDTLGVQSRLHWLIADGREVFFVIETGWEEEPDGTVRPLAREVALKLVWAVRF
jgi:hypothetical protein